MVQGLSSLKAQAESKRWKMYGVYSDSHMPMFQNWFLSTLCDPFEMEFHKTEQRCPSARFMEQGWVDAVSSKIDFLLEILHSLPEDNVFLFSDVDIQWFNPITPILDQIVKEHPQIDLFFQEDGFGEFCTGFFVCRINNRTKQLWQNVRKYMQEKSIGDQKATKLVFEQGAEAKARYLPRIFWGPGPYQTNHDLWMPGKPLYVPKDLLFHHANWTKGVENKIAQFQYVRSEFIRQHSNN